MDTIIDRIEGSGTPGLPSATSVVEDPGKAGQRHARCCLIGLGLGFVSGLAFTAVVVAESYYGYLILPDQLLWNLIWTMSLGLILGHNLGRDRDAGPRVWRRPQLRMRTLMVVVACVAVLMAMGIASKRLGDSSRASFLQYSKWNSLWPPLLVLGPKAEAEARLRNKNVEELRAGKIPNGLLAIQRDFLRGLEVDPKVTPGYRQKRRDGIQSGEERLATIAERNAVVLPATIKYYQQLAAKYDYARWHPWLPVEPDPPAPVW